MKMPKVESRSETSLLRLFALVVSSSFLASHAQSAPAPPSNKRVHVDLEGFDVSCSEASPAAQAQVSVDHRIWNDAIERYSTILARKPDDAKARTMRAELYDQLPATKTLADSDWSMVH